MPDWEEIFYLVAVHAITISSLCLSAKHPCFIQQSQIAAYLK
ncbi:41304_t:CDS:2 [Gigaspora margarita]|uniref:41304_t:CDS:1 n=1 Tax=Gigaspora margarita TaxID=4874 RepID=A0ABN7UL52_GIGMA|nr:41304_t:CDS:2 [Gigaspora margarita]